jgi:glycosyl transferase family 87
LAYVGYAAMAAIVAAWAYRAFHDPISYDTGAAWIAGSVAWHTGHPETLQFWTGMPFLAGAMALVSRILSTRATGYVVSAINVILFGGAALLLLRALRPLLSSAWWWITSFALVSFVPLMSTVWWKQFNLIALVVAAAGFELARRRRARLAGAAIGLSIAIKPMVILLPFVMLARRDTRRPGILAIAWVIVLNMAAQLLMAVRAGQLGPLDPLSGLRNLVNKSQPNLALCHPVDFSPGSLLCRAIGGAQYWTVQRISVLLFVLLLGLWVISALRGRSLLSWDVFAFVCALSAMTSPFEWTHYQLMLAPLFVLLLMRFVREGAGPGAWLGLVGALLLASLIWQPYGTLYGTIRQLLTGHRQDYHAFSGAPEVALQEGLAQFAQYILIITGALWYARRGVTRGADERALARSLG